jgi:hypothetical protein
MTTTPPGWYDDGHGSRRWWDGTAWTAHVQPTPDPAAALALQAGGSPGAGSAPTRSKAWIIWLVVGVVVLGFVVALLLLVPMLFSLISGAGDGGSSGGGLDGSTDDERAAVAVVRQYDEAWATVDCDLLIASTTQRFRDDNGMSVCEQFEESATVFADATDDYVVTVTAIVTDSDGITVETTETFRTLVDGEGNPLDDPEASQADYVYTVIDDGTAWLIDALVSE